MKETHHKATKGKIIDGRRTWSGNCKRCKTELKFGNPPDEIIERLGLTQTKTFRLPFYCRKCYAKDKGIDLRNLSLAEEHILNIGVLKE